MEKDRATVILAGGVIVSMITLLWLLWLTL